jgi:hypothetical protein
MMTEIERLMWEALYDTFCNHDHVAYHVWCELIIEEYARSVN